MMQRTETDYPSQAAHTHAQPVPYGATPTLADVLACPQCNPAAYARNNSTHRKADR